MGDWLIYFLSWICFLGAHVMPARPHVRGRLIAILGRRGYLIGFSILSLILLIWLIRAAGAVDRVMLWDSGVAGRWLINMIMPVAILTGALSVGMAGLVAAFAIWAAAHLIANGDLAHVMLFAGMLAFALAGIRRTGLPNAFRVTRWRLLAVPVLWVVLIGLHPLVVGVSPLP
ncbi:NnrU family protein [Paracoccus sp. Z330]|uniref:NnrU family protein n=1 Tax=Paracoccus onchidii TaxID=3017813 RepID=A0ABT4ZD17_9RHOB|nr:NnrU family protein [Paracoccus onchidii]MDB6177246.1 NnrU family protein [Paracoccus onchidii]